MIVIARLLQFFGVKHNVPRGASMLVYRFFLHPRGELDQTRRWVGGIPNERQEHHGSFQGVRELDMMGVSRLGSLRCCLRRTTPISLESPRSCEGGSVSRCVIYTQPSDSG